MRVRDYTLADRSACLAVFDGNVPRFFAPFERAEFAAFLDTPLPGPYLVVEDGAGGVLGCGGYRVRAGTADLCWGMVRRERHGSGLGRLLLDARLERIHSDPAVRAVAVHTSQHTRGFYERRDFQVERVTPDGYAPGLDRCDLRLVLPPPGERDRHAAALAWVVSLLQRHRIPFQAVGGLAARAYGATRPLVDLDFYLPMERFAELLPEVAPHLVRGPEPYRDGNWDLTFAKLAWAGAPIELGDAGHARYFDRAAGAWVRQEIRFERSVWREVLGVRVPVIPRAELIAYKRRLDREVDRLDVGEIDR